MERIHLVTGAAGHVGATLCRSLCAQGARVRALVLEGESTVALSGLALEIYEADVCDYASLSGFFADLDESEVYVYHLAGVISIQREVDASIWAVNVQGTKNVLAWSEQIAAQRFLYVSTVHALPLLPKPEQMHEISSFAAAEVEGAYAKSKAAATEVVLAAARRGFPAIVVHPSGILGPNDYGQGHITELIASYVNHRLPALVKGGYDFVDVRDVVSGIVAAINKGRVGACYILAGAWHSIAEVVNTMADILGRPKRRFVVPLAVAKLGAALSSFFAKARRSKPLFTPYSLFTLASNANYSHKLAQQELAYEPRPLRQTLQDTLYFMQKQQRFLKPLRRRELSRLEASLVH